MSKEVAKRRQTAVTSTAAEQMVDSGRAYSPDVDIFQSDNELLLLVDLPGVEQGSVDINLDEANTLTIRAKNANAEPEGVLMRQFEVGDYYRAFRIGEEFDRAKISGRLKNGLLEVRIPRREETKPRRIEINA